MLSKNISVAQRKANTVYKRRKSKASIFIKALAMGNRRVELFEQWFNNIITSFTACGSILATDGSEQEDIIVSTKIPGADSTKQTAEALDED